MILDPGQIIGTCMTNSEIAEKFGISEDDVEDYLLNYNVERCSGCGWWFESGELTPDEDTEPDDDDLVGKCQDCRK